MSVRKNVLVIGSGGREHAMVYSLLCSALVERVFVMNGNGGTQELSSFGFVPQGAAAPVNVALDVRKHEEVAKFAKENAVELVVVGPEAPLSEGIADSLEAAGLKVFGCSGAAARLESSKIFMKDVCVKAGVKTAAYGAFVAAELEAALSFARSMKGKIVIKADGLAAGKGVVIAESAGEAEEEIRAFLGGKFGEASRSIVIEEFLEGKEASFFAFSDGKTAISFSHACDYKQVFDGGRGANTGGMGTFSPSFLTEEQESKVMKEVILPVVEELARRGIPYKGVLFAGLMVHEGEVKVLEFNARMGDPETQSILPRLGSDFYEICERCATGRLEGFGVQFKPDYAVSVVLASRGYPESPELGFSIALPSHVPAGSFIFHAGTKREGEALKTSGGRVLAVTSLGKTLLEAREKSYDLARQIHFEGMHFRTDIGGDGR